MQSIPHGESKVICSFSTVWGQMPLTSMLFKGQLYLFSELDVTLLVLALYVAYVHTKYSEIHIWHEGNTASI